MTILNGRAFLLDIHHIDGTCNERPDHQATIGRDDGADVTDEPMLRLLGPELRMDPYSIDKGI